MRLVLRVLLAATWLGCFFTDKFLPNGQNGLPVLWSGGICILVLLFYQIFSSEFLRTSSLQPTWTDSLVLMWFVYRWIRDRDLNFYNLAGPQHYTDVVLLAQYCCFRIVAKSEDFTLVIAILLIITTIQGAYAILQLLNLIEGNNNVWRVTGSFFNPAPLACYLSIGLCFAFNFLLRGGCSNLYRWLLYICIIICVVALLVTKSRAAYLATSAAGLYLISQGRLSVHLTYFNYWWKSIGIGLIASVLIVCLYGIRPDSGLGRLLIWKISFQIIRDHLLWGAGYHSFSSIFGLYQITYFSSKLASPLEIQLASNGQFAFNEWVSTAVELGIVGVIIWTLLILVPLFSGCKGSNLPKAITLGSRASIIAWGVFATLSYPQAIFSLQQQLLLCLAILSCNSRVQNSFINKLGIRKISLFSLTLIMIIFTSSYSYLFYQWHMARTYLLRNRFGKAASYYSKNYCFLNNETEFLLEYSESLIHTNQPAMAIQVLETAALHVSNLDVYSGLSKLYFKTNNYFMTEIYLRKSIFVMPYLIQPKFALFTFYKRQGRVEEAIGVAQDILLMSSKVPNIRAEYYHRQAFNYINNNACSY